MSKKVAEVEQLPLHETYEQRRDLGDTRVTLDGKPARITGFRLPFAWIQSNDDTVEFAWSTVARVVANDREFFTDFNKARAARKAKCQAAKLSKKAT